MPEKKKSLQKTKEGSPIARTATATRKREEKGGHDEPRNMGYYPTATCQSKDNYTQLPLPGQHAKTRLCLR